MSDPDQPTIDRRRHPTAHRRGLAAERTHLAWGRSALSFVLCGLAVARGIPGVTDDGRPVFGMLLVALGGVVWVAASPWRLLPGRDGGLRPRRSGQLAAVAIGTSLVGTAALIIASITVP
jgi:uncharacterized membrane protein YidH (DUF202 family)